MRDITIAVVDAAVSALNVLSVMAGHSRSKNGVASLAYVPPIHVLAARQTWMPA
jgi:hypothetical protein